LSQALIYCSLNRRFISSIVES